MTPGNFDGITELTKLAEFMNGNSNGLNSEELARRVIGLAMRVHRELGCGFLESIYGKALAMELEESGLVFELQPILPVFYKGKPLGVFQPDLIVDNRLIVELKAVDALHISHSVQLVNYLFAANIEHGLLLNFGSKSLQFKTKTKSQPDPPHNPIDFHS